MRHVLASFTFTALVLSGQTASKYELPAEQRTGSIKRILVLPHAHLDIGFTLPPDQVARDYKDSIDAALRLVRENPDFRWTIESTWMLDQWLRRTRNSQLIEELGSYLREGRISLAAGFANMHSGLIGDEEMNRLAYLAEEYRNRFSIPVEVAIQNDVPGFSWAYPRVFAGSGVKYLITGLNLFIGGGNNFGVRNNPFYWKGPDGSRVLTFFTYESYVEGHRWGLTRGTSIKELEKTVPRRLAWLEQNGYAYDTYLLMAAVGDNADPMHAFRILEKVREWNRRHADLPMQMCTPEDYFRYVTDKSGDRFPEFSGDATGHWELVKLGAPEVASRMRETASLLPAAEALHHIAELLKGGEPPWYDLREAWHELLVFHEHTAGAGPGWPGYYTRWQTDWSNASHYASAMSGYSNARQLFDKAIARLTGETGIFDPAVKTGSDETTVLVYNGLSWARGGPVEVDRIPAALRHSPLEVVDRVTREVHACEDVPGTSHRILFYAPSIPATGYRLFTLRASARPGTRVDYPIDAETNESGWIRALRQKGGADLIGTQADRPFGSLVFANQNREYEPVSVGAAKMSTNDGPVTRRIEIAREGSPLRRTTVTVYAGASFADLAFEVDLEALSSRAGRIGIALPLSGPEQLWVDGAGFVYRVPEDMLPGGSARQFTTVHFAHWGRSGAPGVTIATRDAAMLLRDGTFLVASQSLQTQTRDEGTQTLHRTEPHGSDVQTFRFRIARHSGGPAEWKRFGQDLNLPLQAAVISGTHLPAEQSFLSVDATNVVVSAFKPSGSDPEWSLIRLQEVGGENATVRVAAPFKIRDAVYATTVESRTAVTVDLNSVSIQPWQTITILARIERRGK